MYSYTYTIDGIHHNIKSISPIPTANADGVIPISDSQNEVCRKLKILLREWIKLAKKNNIHWFCNGGTLLGAVRDKGLIHYDNDLDLVILLQDYDKIKHLHSKKCVIDVCEQGFQIHLKNQSYPFIDLWLEGPNPDNSSEIVLACPYLNERPMYCGNMVWPNEKYMIDDVMNVVQLPFEDMMVNVPSNYESYIKRQYGDDCLIRYVIHDHTENHAVYDIIPSPEQRILFWEASERLFQRIGLDKCNSKAGKESHVLIALLVIQLATPSKNKIKRHIELLSKYIQEKIKDIL